jgi:peptidyl-prolyl cis-trans isomerase SurA
MFTAGCNRPHQPDVVATVNGHPIDQATLERYYRSNIGNNPQKPSPIQSQIAHLEILRNLIDDDIKQQRAAKLNLVATDEEVDAKLAEIKAPFTQEEFNRQLKAKNMTLDDLKHDIRRGLTNEKLMNKEIFSKINITDADISEYYNATWGALRNRSYGRTALSSLQSASSGPVRSPTSFLSTTRPTKQTATRSISFSTKKPPANMS